jgi:hypothetical protein
LKEAQSPKNKAQSAKVQMSFKNAMSKPLKGQSSKYKEHSSNPKKKACTWHKIHPAHTPTWLRSHLFVPSQFDSFQKTRGRLANPLYQDIRRVLLKVLNKEESKGGGRRSLKQTYVPG